MIKLEHITQHYGVRPVLRDLSLTVERGELVALMGPNGMGKSTTLAVMAGVLWPQKGRVVIDGRVRRACVDDELAIRRSVVYLPDHPWLPANRTGREFLVSVGKLYGIEDEALMDHVDRLLKLFHLDGNGDAPIRSYSNGQKKKLAIAGALVTEAPVLLLDEPFTGGLDPSGILALRRVLQQLAQNGHVTIVMATQLPEIAEALASRVAVLRDGHLLAYDTIDRLRQSPGETLANVLERLIHPQTLQNIDAYFRRPMS
ncbi:MAG: ATP-binding cassette domain-containing protein [Planctomycetes bacterium]|nr:ATP-binding cassette domain-containing protein [Planctomycetota bacterium]